MAVEDLKSILPPDTYIILPDGSPKDIDNYLNIPAISSNAINDSNINNNNSNGNDNDNNNDIVDNDNNSSFGSDNTTYIISAGCVIGSFKGNNNVDNNDSDDDDNNDGSNNDGSNDDGVDVGVDVGDGAGVGVDVGDGGGSKRD